MKVLSVKASKREYEIVLEKDFSRLSEKVEKLFHGKLLIVYDQNTHPLFSSDVKRQLANYELLEVILPAGEDTKNIENYVRLLSFLAENNFTRGDGVLAVGGGVIGDLCGFVASTYMRGITYLACPTTLLSCVDSSIGGKTAVNLAEGKNLVGAFYAPSLVYIATSSLESLSQREIECGLGEVVKYAFLDKGVTLEDVKNGEVEDLILKCLEVKKKYVENDEFDRGERAKLNLGHTIGHAVESLSGYAFSHGLCVAKGIDKIIDISCKFYGHSEEKKKELKALLNCKDFDLSIDFSKQELLSKIKIDKKAESGAVSLILIKDIANIEVVKMPLEKLMELM
ncbi:MAG: 3-dehydroquinate synthase [Clostridia bacterium]|nr:3-dehydroquinate synthase [Clostridia bacterium]